ncbi:S-adenosyl-L-methionine-dependent methyltransferase [Clohesyomyces aquaticus]|uniref:S-adenosyl-L-methionine-dependent methyltransferase n=1 Tax=Clohesyomyces aquaticus TaxID=1231657 RepID=A0A1Y2A9S3_9PLEO|nr:S-adenosyl-L-methionine-dependent methyltransferase [Clohesyomyces aquaticus]
MSATADPLDPHTTANYVPADTLIPESDVSKKPSYRSSTTSVDSEVYATVEEFGRTYHGYKAGKYVMPNDEKERDRLDLQHMLFTQTVDGRLNTAPISSPQQVLDIATGTGIWAMDFAEQHPNSNVLGTDLSPIQPSYVPINCTFEIADAEDEWNFGTQFDYIHGRALLSCFTEPREMIRKAYESLAPGGYLELQDGFFPFKFLNPQPAEDNPVRRWLDFVQEATHKSGRSWDNVQHYAQWMAELGFVDVVEKRYNWPCGPWAKGDKMKRLGVYFMEDLSHAAEPICMKLFTRFLGWDEERVKAFVAELMPALMAKKLYLYETIVFVHGRKPFTNEGSQS